MATARENEDAPQLRGSEDTRIIPSRFIRHVAKPRWVATYEGGMKQGRRRVGLLVPRPSRQNPEGRSQIAHAASGKLMEFRIGSHSTWWTAHASELTREQWQAIRAFYRGLPPAR